MGLLGDIALGLAGMALDALAGNSENSTNENEKQSGCMEKRFHIIGTKSGSEKFTGNADDLFKELYLKWNEIFVKTLNTPDEDIYYDFSIPKNEGDVSKIEFTLKNAPFIKIRINKIMKALCCFDDESKTGIAIGHYFDVLENFDIDGFRLVKLKYVQNSSQPGWGREYEEDCEVERVSGSAPLEEMLQYLFGNTEIYQNFVKFLDKLRMARDNALNDKFIFLINSFSKKIQKNDKSWFIGYLETINSRAKMEISDLDLYSKFIKKWDDIFMRGNLFDGISYSVEQDKESKVLDSYSKDNIKINHYNKIENKLEVLKNYAKNSYIRYRNDKIIYYYAENSYLGFELIGEHQDGKYDNDPGKTIFKLDLWQSHENQEKIITSATLEYRTQSEISFELFFTFIGKHEIGKHFSKFLNEMENIKNKALKDQEELEKQQQDKAKNDALAALDNI